MRQRGDADSTRATLAIILCQIGQRPLDVLGV